jgi:hypothetical protein
VKKKKTKKKKKKQRNTEETRLFILMCALVTGSLILPLAFSLDLSFYRRLMEEDDGALSEIEPDSVPNEVRDWLAMTFTRSMSTIKRRPSDKPKFKSVAQAIRAGIMVDR